MHFLITRYTGCRNGATNGLRHCDIDLENKTISFANWEKAVTYNKLRGGKRRENQVRRLKTSKDESTIPMSTKLYEAIKDIALNRDQMIQSGREDIRQMTTLGDIIIPMNTEINME